jgi:hypothetical protein
MANATQKPIYFVLGNHDYYRGGIDDVRSKITSLTVSLCFNLPGHDLKEP